MSVRKTLRKEIALTASVRQLLARRGAGVAAEALAACAACTPVPKEERAPGWGFVRPDQSVMEVLPTLLDKADLVTLIEASARTAARPRRSPDRAGGAGRQLPAKPAPDDAAEAGAVESSLSLASASIPIPKTSWNPAATPVSRFGTAAGAMRQIGAGWSDGRIGQAHPVLTGANVNVVIVDTGLSRQYLRSIHPELNYGGGFVDREPERPDPGAFVDVVGKPGDWHGNMIARNVLRVAPRARIFDAPLLPGRVADVESFTEDAIHLFEAIEREAETGPYCNEPWVIVNAWAVADTIQEWDLGLPAEERYTDGRAHPFNRTVARMAARFDIVFAAGNFGAYAPDVFSGLYDRGNGRSIKGANALPEVLTIGSVTTAGEWIGAASHGLGPSGLMPGGGGVNRKPDLAAPSWFAEDNDPGLVSTGTSASSALAAGMLAALRTRHRSESPAEMFEILRNAAHNRGGEVWNGRTGFGAMRLPEDAA